MTKMDIDFLIIDVNSDLELAITYFEDALRVSKIEDFNEIINKSDRDSIIMHKMMAGYSSIENCFKRILSFYNEKIINTDSWHSELLRIANTQRDNFRPKIISDEMSSKLYILKSFRHIAIHAYNRFDLDQAEPALKAAKYVIENLNHEINNFFDSLYSDNEKSLSKERSSSGRWKM